MAGEAPRVTRVAGDEVRGWADRVAALRIDVFREWPYLYEGDMDYERRYLRRYVDTPDSCLVLALDGDQVVGVSTALPLRDAEPTFRAPFEQSSEWDAAQVFYLGESVLLHEYRGLGVGHRFFDEREAAARELGFATTAFCAVERLRSDPRRPPAPLVLDDFWRKRGYVRRPQLRCKLAWRDLGEQGESDKDLVFWTRTVSPLE